MEVKNNPAGRLYDLLHAARQRPEQEKARVVWGHVFGVADNDTGALLKMLADLFNLVHEAKGSIERLQNVDHKIYLRPFSTIEVALSHINLEAPWQHWKQRLDEPTLYGLEFAADQLSRVSGFTQIKNEELDGLRSDLDELISQVLESELPHDLKMFFMRNLEAVRQALLAYRVRGIDGLQEEIERCVGGVILRWDQVKATAPKSAEADLWGKYFKLIDRFNKAVEFAKNVGHVAGPAALPLLTLIASQLGR